MPAVIAERHNGRRGGGTQRERRYYITAVSTEAEAHAALLGGGGAPGTLDGFPRSDAECDVEELEPGRYIGTAVYRAPGSSVVQQPNSFSVSFDISGQSTRITQSKATIARYGANDSTADDLHGVINLQDDGTIEGVEILVPALSYTVTYTFEDSAITTGFVNTLALLVGTVNDAAFHGYAAGELLLTRVSGQKRNDSTENWDLTYGFAVSRNVAGGVRPNGDNFHIPTPIASNGFTEANGRIRVVEKKGWDYLWVYYQWQAYGSGADKRTKKIPIAVYVERVYDFCDFSDLGI